MLKKFFNEVTIYGQSVSGKVMRLEALRKNNLSAVQKTSGFLKKIIPAKIKDFMINMYQFVNIKLINKVDENEISELDFRISKDNIETARYFVVVCQ